VAASKKSARSHSITEKHINVAAKAKPAIVRRVLLATNGSQAVIAL
jgi:hypothetical protein